MKSENKLSLREVYALARSRIGDPLYPTAKLDDLLWCWRRHVHKTRAGKDGWLSRTNAENFVRYVY